MRREENAVIAAKIVNIVCAVLLTLSGVLLLCLPDLQTVTTQRVVFGVLFFLMCAAKVFGYFTNDLYRLAFQFDFAIGVFCGLLALMLVITPERAFHSLPTVITAFVVLDARLAALCAGRGAHRRRAGAFGRRRGESLGDGAHRAHPRPKEKSLRALRRGIKILPAGGFRLFSTGRTGYNTDTAITKKQEKRYSNDKYGQLAGSDLKRSAQGAHSGDDVSDERLSDERHRDGL